ncbi:MAG: ABC transporter substrate-binding protein [Anaerolineae bacterium]|nr:ABC transporter substrate-binding protein [Anaerolineae bacterium]
MSKVNLPKRLATFVLVALLALLPSVLTVRAEDEPIVIGVAVAQTTNVALFGQEQVIGARIAEEFFNERGGINGRPFRLVFADTGGDEAGAINAFQTLINRENVVGILGPTLSQQAFAADPIADQAGVPVIAPSNTARGIPQIGRFIFRVSAPVNFVAPNAVKQAIKIKPDLKRVAVFYAQNDAFSVSETGVFQQTVKDLGLELLDVQTFQTTDTDFTTQITNVLPLDPELIIISGLAADGGNLVRQLREFGYKGLIVGGNGFNTTNLFPVCQALCDGILVAQAYSYQAESEINQAFRKAYKAQQGKEPPQFSAQAFTGIQVFVEALRRLDERKPLKDMDLKTLRAELRDEIMNGKYDTPLGPLSFIETKKDDGTPAGGEIVQERFYVARIEMDPDGKSGRFTFITDQEQK